MENEPSSRALYKNVLLTLLFLLLFGPVLYVYLLYYPFIFRMTNFPVPSHDVASYQKLVDACAPHQMIMPDESTFPFDSDSTTYTVGLSSRSKIKWHKNVETYHVHSGMESESGRWWWCLDCSRNQEDLSGSHMEKYRDIPIYWWFKHYYRSYNDGTANGSLTYDLHLQFLLGDFEYHLNIGVESKNHFDETIGNELRPMVHSIIDQWYTEDGAVPGPDPL